MIFNATTNLLYFSLAMNTFPNFPWPSYFPNWKSPRVQSFFY